LGNFLKITKVAKNFVRASFSRVKAMHFLTKNGLGSNPSYFFTNSSGHPAVPLLQSRLNVTSPIKWFTKSLVIFSPTES
jgi:hypothetical protein